MKKYSVCSVQCSESGAGVSPASGGGVPPSISIARTDWGFQRYSRNDAVENRVALTLTPQAEHYAQVILMLEQGLWVASIPKGLRPKAQGCPGGGTTLGKGDQNNHDPNGVASHVRVMDDGGHNPVGVEDSTLFLPRVARSSQPWALGRNAVGVLRCRLVRNAQPPRRGNRMRLRLARSPFGSHFPALPSILPLLGGEGRGEVKRFSNDIVMAKGKALSTPFGSEH